MFFRRRAKSRAAAKSEGRWWNDPKVRTTVAVNLTSIIERADEQVLPAMYSYVGPAFDARPEALGVLTFCRAIAQALASPFAGVVGHRRNRTHVITFGCVLWGLATSCFGLVESLALGRLLWVVNGVGLALVIPNLQSLTADYFQSDARGKAFGVLFSTSALGATAGQLYATNLGGDKILGVDGWRFVMVSIGLYSFLMGAVMLLVGSDPRYASSSTSKRHGRHSSDDSQLDVATDEPNAATANWAAILNILKIPTFAIIIIQGIFGSFPWQAMTYLTHYFQLVGMSDMAASLVVSSFHVSTALGGLIGGILGDHFGKKFANHGRIFTCQFSVGIKLPLIAVLFKCMPLTGDSTTVAMYILLMMTIGVLAPWAAAACNNPIFAEIVPPSHRSMVYGFDRAFEGALAALGAPLVGILAQKMGYKGNVEVTGIRETDLHNAHALGNALVFWMIGPWTMCLLLYSFVHLTYPRDKIKHHHHQYTRLEADNSDGHMSSSMVAVNSGNRLAGMNDDHL